MATAQAQAREGIAIRMAMGASHSKILVPCWRKAASTVGHQVTRPACVGSVGCDRGV